MKYGIKDVAEVTIFDKKSGEVIIKQPTMMADIKIIHNTENSYANSYKEWSNNNIE